MTISTSGADVRFDKVDRVTRADDMTESNETRGMTAFPASRRRFLKAAGLGLLATACAPWEIEGPLGAYAPYLRPMLPEDWPSLGLSAKGIRIAVIDTGFGRVQTRPSTRGLNIVAAHDAVDADGSGVYNDRARHGTEMLEGIGGHDGTLVYGLAHQADYLLVRGEDEFSELAADEHRAAEAITWAAGQDVDLINVSLSFTTFTDGSPYSNAQLDGFTSVISRTLAEALQRNPKLVAIVSAGNEGDTDWRYTGFPGDVQDALTMGAVQMDLRTPRITSGRGAPYSAWIKPDLVIPSGMGATSLATAAMTGLVACLRQRFPGADRGSLLRALRSSASGAAKPNRVTGLGIPSARRAMDMLSGIGRGA